MAVMIFSGLPGKGKTANATRLALKEFSKHNSFIFKFFYNMNNKDLNIKEALKKDEIKGLKKLVVNKIYSNYPILLDQKKKIYSNIIKPLDLNMVYKLPKGSVVIFDEMQRYYDSREFKKFPRDVGTFVQHHRHADIKYIVFVTQHPRRLDNKIRDLAEIFRKYRVWFKFPLLPLVLVTYTDYFEFEDYGLYNKVKKEYQTYDYKNGFRFMITKKLYNAYDNKYFKVIFNELDPINDVNFVSKELTIDEVKAIGIND